MVLFKILTTFQLEPKVLTQLQKSATVTFCKNRSQVVSKLAQSHALICDLTFPIDKALLKNATLLRVVGTCSAGTNHIDLIALKKSGVALVNTPGVLTRATAELTLALLLAVARRVPEGMQLVSQNQFRGWKMDLLLGQELQGKTAVLVGKGQIGQETAHLFRALGLKTQFVTRSSSEETIRNQLSQADVVSLHCPLTADTHHWLSARRISYLKPQCIVINTARGPVIDENALIRALERGKIFGAGLDVYENEPKIPAALRRLPNVVLLPHLGSATRTTRSSMQKLVADSVLSILFGKAPLNQVRLPL